jgi:hypothetical protein
MLICGVGGGGWVCQNGCVKKMAISLTNVTLRCREEPGSGLWSQSNGHNLYYPHVVFTYHNFHQIGDGVNERPYPFAGMVQAWVAHKL